MIMKSTVMVQAFKLLVKNKYYMMICGTYILQQLYGAMIGAGIYYMTWVLKNEEFIWTICMGSKYSTDHCPDFHTDISW